MSNGSRPEGWFLKVESLLRRILQALEDLKDKLAKLAQDVAQANRPNPNSGSGGWVGYTHATIPMRTSNVPGTTSSPQVETVFVPANAGDPYKTTGAPFINPTNGTGGTVPASVYCGGNYVNGIPVLTWADCAPGTYNGQTGSAPPAQFAPMQTQSGQDMMTQDGQMMVTQ